MHDLSHRAAIATLLLSGVLTVVSPLALPEEALTSAGALWPVVMHGQFLVGLLGAGLVLATFVPHLRLGTIGAAIASKAGFLAITAPGGGPVGAGQWLEAVLLVMLLLAALVLGAHAVQQARWEGVLPSRQET